MEQLGVPGLVNLGSTCYLNASLQALASCGTLVAQLGGALQALQPGCDGPDDQPRTPLAAALFETLRALQPRPGASQPGVAPGSLLHELRSRLPAGVLEAGEEHDAAEAVEHLCAEVAEELASAFVRDARPQLTAHASLAALLAGPARQLAPAVATPCSAESCSSCCRACNSSRSTAAPSSSDDGNNCTANMDSRAAAAAVSQSAATSPAAAAPTTDPPPDAVLAGWRRLARLPLHGSTAHELRCLRCGHCSAAHLEPFWVLQLSIPTAPGQTLLGNVAAAPGASLAACLASLFGFEALQGVHCTRCSLAASLDAAEATDVAARGAAAESAGAVTGPADPAAVQAGPAEAAHTAPSLQPDLQRLQQSLAAGGKLIEGESYRRLIEAAGLTWRPRPCPFAKRAVAARLPPVLCLQLRRGFWSPSGHYCKVAGHVSFPLALHFAAPLLGHERPPPAPQHAAWQPQQESQAPGEGQRPFLLRAVVVHHGPLAGAGHYTVFRRLDGLEQPGAAWSGSGGEGTAATCGGGGKDTAAACGGPGGKGTAAACGGGGGNVSAGASGGRWVRASDEAVHPAEAEEVLAAEATLLLYERPPA